MYTPALVKIFPDIHRDRHTDLLCQHEQFFHQTVLDRCKSGKLVQHDHTITKQFGLFCHIIKKL